MPLPQKKMTLTIRPGEDTLVSPDKLGDKRTRFFIVKNISDTEKGNCRVAIK